jgi:hypothetical protein
MLLKLADRGDRLASESMAAIRLVPPARTGRHSARVYRTAVQMPGGPRSRLWTVEKWEPSSVPKKTATPNYHLDCVCIGTQ